ncbi:tRNA (adenosine(37)-N6)-dimethylallyltransferase MiaA [Cloacibacillus sp.]|uniref:tRNA (adenosine(37)-N6)-dimethylallyltransferase MiaA n=1 Tax=Cloacibacillus sp. TaxID=2049023 RepID=UPI0025BA834E|nr:tRNA (adenosine(37)-N6)-dimethylallyltransferase MiaA [Cloacibacillus sp.]MCC8057429.1 tRNA (adenosine(37)-N6)-dimethylallyltransferase MiaA [Cloacibacillus sp.]
MTDKKIPVIAIIGPTAVGKTEFSLSLAARLNVEVISVDSRQVYRYLDVGTDKVSREIRREVIHHLIDVVDPDQVYSAADFAEDAEDAVNRIMARGRVPLLIGGTPFYYRALTGMLSEDLPKDENVRSQLEAEITVRGLSALHQELMEIDPEAGAKIHQNDPVRTMRALEIFRITGKNASWWYRRQNKMESPYEILYIGLTRLRANLYLNIERRVKEQFASGYPEEVKWLLDNGYSPSLPALQGFGYRELVRYIGGECTFLEAIEGDIRSTKAFSRRQMTWFKHFEPALWYDFDKVSKEEALRDVVPRCLAHLEGGA